MLERTERVLRATEGAYFAPDAAEHQNHGIEAKKAALRKISFSSRRIFFSRRSLASSALSALARPSR
jgi:hypothetical protein